MKQPEGFDDNSQKACKLRKSIYGLKQASVNDDILLASNDLGLLHETKGFLSQNFEMKDLGEASYVIGIEIHRDRKQRILKLSQKAYIEKVLERFRLKNCNGSVAPIIKGDRFSNDQCPRNALEKEQMKDILYSSAVDSLLYAQVCTRPDIAMAVGMLGRYQSNQDWNIGKLQRKLCDICKEPNITVVGYSDSDFAGCVDSRKSTSGYIFLLAGGAISWRSSKQTIVATSTMEAEFIACYEATTQALWLKIFVGGLKIVDSIERPIKIFCDNRVAIFFSKNKKSGSRSKHIDIKYLHVRDNIKRHEVFIEHISTELMIADPMTKGLPTSAPRKWRPSQQHCGLELLIIRAGTIILSFYLCTSPVAQITDDPFGALNSWNESFHFCEWSGVTCGRRHQRVVELDLHSYKHRENNHANFNIFVDNTENMHEMYCDNKTAIDKIH
uniref:Reverse transcriptase Ty1/copia-type domain-containing protein n=1 Tax=Salix viminalis TaxID=40686 RepID=A0A6N2NK50_SALVM